MHEFWKRFHFRQDKATDGGGSGDGAAGGLGLADGGAKGGAGGGSGSGATSGSGGSTSQGGAGDDGKGGGGAAGAAGDKGKEVAGSWRDSLPEALRGSKSLEKFKDPVALAQSYLSLESAAGKKGLVVPADSATEEEWGAFYKAIGRPDAADKYELKTPDGVTLKIDENFLKGFREVAHKLGMPAKMAAGVFDWYLKEGDGRVKAGGVAAQAARTKDLDDLKKDWGEKFAGNVNEAKLAIDAVVPEQFKKQFKERGYGEDPLIARIFQAVASKYMSEDELREGGEGTMGSTIQDMETELADLNDPAKSPRFKQDDPKREWANNRVAELRKELKRLKKTG